MKTRVLITGGAGNIGGSLARVLVNKPGFEVVVVDDLTTGSLQNLLLGLPQFEFVQADVNHPDFISALSAKGKFDYIFHYAAVVGVQRTLSHPLRVLKDIDGIRNILELAKEMKVKRIFYSSSSEVYGEPVSHPQFEESTPLNSRLPYAIVKNLGEAYFKSYFQEYGINYTIFRFFNTYGPAQSRDFVVPRFLNAALLQEPITIYGDGNQTRTFCFIDDNIDATLSALMNDLAINETVNIGNDEEITISELAKRIIRITGSGSPIVHLPSLKEGDMTRRKPDITRMKHLLKRPLTSLETGINKLMLAQSMK